jgi:capsular exopolysaccharide synthesis family protein
VEQPDARVAAFAPLPVEPSGPSWMVNLVIGAVLGAIVFAIFALVKQIFAVGVGSPEEVESIFGIDFLAAVPRLRGEDDLGIINQVVDAPSSPYAEAIRALAAGLFAPGQVQPQVVALTSALAAEGKTSTAIALGRSQALRGRRVLIVDCDLQRPTFRQRFGIGNSGPGLIEVLNGSARLTDCLTYDTKTSACFLGVGEGIEPGQALEFEQLQAMIVEARGQFDLVLLDLPPVLQVAETRGVAAAADGVILLTRWKHTSRQAVEFAITMLARAGNPVLGLVLTEVPATSDIVLGSYAKPPERLRLANA